MRVEVLRAEREQEPVLRNLIELYAHDFSEFHALELGEDGRFGYEPLPLYWSDPSRHPFLIRVDGKLAGLILVNRIDNVSDIAEFFVTRGHRRGGVGTRAAHEVWNRFPGPWQVRVMDANVAGRRFWSAAIEKFTGSAIQPEQVDTWSVFSFLSRSADPGNYAEQ